VKTLDPGCTERLPLPAARGGTGKTTVATNLAYVASRSGRRVAYLDCDVEEPNGHIFLKPTITDQTPIESPSPQVDHEKCILCGECGEICQFSAIVRVGEKILVYHDLCHACGGCSLVCPVDAISEVPRELGMLQTGRSGTIVFAQGLLNIGQPSSPPVIKAVHSTSFQTDLIIVDAPPGTSCPTIEAIRGADFVVLVTEPTPFGFHDLKLAVKMVRVLGLPFGVVVNRAGNNGIDLQAYCKARQIPLLLEILEDRKLAEEYSRGIVASEALPKYEAIFNGLLKTLLATEDGAG